MSRPRLKLGPPLLPGVVAVGLFAVMAWVFLNASFGEPAGFEEGASVVDSIGFALIDVTDAGIPTEGFLVALIVIALVLDAALDGAIHLARREEDDATTGGEH